MWTARARFEPAARVSNCRLVIQRIKMARAQHSASPSGGEGLRPGALAPRFVPCDGAVCPPAMVSTTNAWSRLRTAKNASEARLALESLSARIHATADSVPAELRTLRPLAQHLAHPTTAIEAAMVLRALASRADSVALLVRGGFVAPLCAVIIKPPAGQPEPAKLRGWALAALNSLARMTAEHHSGLRAKLPDACLPALIHALHPSNPAESRAWAADAIAHLLRDDSAATAVAIRLGLVPHLATTISSAARFSDGPKNLEAVETAARASLGALGDVVQLAVGRARVLQSSKTSDGAQRQQPSSDPVPLIVDTAVSLLLRASLAPAAASFLKRLCVSGGVPAARAALLSPALPAALPLLLSADSDDDELADAELDLTATTSTADHPAAPVRSLVVAIAAQLLSAPAVASAYAAAAHPPDTTTSTTTTTVIGDGVASALRALRATARDVHQRAASSRHPAHRAAALLLDTLQNAIDLELTRAIGHATNTKPAAAQQQQQPLSPESIVAPVEAMASLSTSREIGSSARQVGWQEANGGGIAPYPEPMPFLPNATGLVDYTKDPSAPPPPPYLSTTNVDGIITRPPAPIVPSAAVTTAWSSTEMAPTAALASAALRKAEACEQRAFIERQLMSRALSSCEERAFAMSADGTAGREVAKAAEARCEALSRAAIEADKRCKAMELRMEAAEAAEERSTAKADAAEKRAVEAEAEVAKAEAAGMAKVEERLNTAVSEAVGKAVEAAEAAAVKASSDAADAATAEAEAASMARTSDAVRAAVEETVRKCRAEQENALKEAQRVHGAAMAAALELTRRKHTEEMESAKAKVKEAEERVSASEAKAERASKDKQELETRSYQQVREARRAAEQACRSAADAHARSRSSELAREEAIAEHDRLLTYLQNELSTTGMNLANVGSAITKSSAATTTAAATPTLLQIAADEVSTNIVDLGTIEPKRMEGGRATGDNGATARLSFSGASTSKASRTVSFEEDKEEEEGKEAEEEAGEGGGNGEMRLSWDPATPGISIPTLFAPQTPAAAPAPAPSAPVPMSMPRSGGGTAARAAGWREASGGVAFCAASTPRSLRSAQHPLRPSSSKSTRTVTVFEDEKKEEAPPLSARSRPQKPHSGAGKKAVPLLTPRGAQRKQLEQLRA